MSDFEKELKNDFLAEAAQGLADAEQCFLELETNADDPAIIDKIFRLAHNLKGSANAVGFDQMGKFAHIFESYLSKLKVKQGKITNRAVSLLLECNDHLIKMVELLKQNPENSIESATLISKIQNEIDSVGNLDNEDQVNNSNEYQTKSITPTQSKNVTATDDNIRVSLIRLERLINFVGEMVILQTVLKEQIQNSEQDLVKRVTHQLGKVTKEVQDIAMSLRMVPLKQTFHKMQRIVRDTSQSLGKSVTLEFHGEETEVDKTILEKLSDPLVHLIRNAVDHGIELPEKRIEAKKSQ